MTRWFVLALALAGCGESFESELFVALEGGSDAKEEVVEVVEAGNTEDANQAGADASVADSADGGELLDGDGPERVDAQADALSEEEKEDASLVCPSAACTMWCANQGKVDTCQAGACVCVS